MGLKDIDLKNSYSSDNEDVLNDFYIPVLSESIEYKRLTGFFSSSSLAVAARGIINLIENDGKMKILSGAVLSESDIESIKKGIKEPQEIIKKYILKDIDEMRNEFIRNHVEALGWLIAKNKLEIKIAILKDENDQPISSEEVSQTGIFHEKVGILRDQDGNRISFSGSINETACGWKNNIEQFKIFREWDASEKKYFKFDLEKFENFWKNKGERVEVIDVPQAVEYKLIEEAPDHLEKLKTNLKREKDNGINLRDYQKSAIESWKKNDNQGILDMCTGSGKTWVGLFAINDILDPEDFVIFLFPNKDLLRQWVDKDIKEFENKRIFDEPVSILECYGETDWKNKIGDFIQANYNQKYSFIVSTMDSALNDIFQKNVSDYIENKNLIILVDEVHNIGSEQRKKVLEKINARKGRLGLSATPERNDEGDEAIFDYFDKIVFEYDMGKAIEEGYLTPYEYYIHPVSLTQEELERYNELTNIISKKYMKHSNGGKKDFKTVMDNNSYLENLIYQRANILKGCDNKVTSLIRLIEEEKDKLGRCLIYCSNLEQLDRVCKKIDENTTLGYLKYTGGHDDEQRHSAKKQFDKGIQDFLVAIKCLDEGIDIPKCDSAIILASSTSDREFIQRRGRVLRKHPDKDKSIIHDFIVLPYPLEEFKEKNVKLSNNEFKIIKKELRRAKLFLENADNKNEEYIKIYRLNKQIEGCVEDG